MKKKILLGAFLITSFCNAQNEFPSSGNVGIGIPSASASSTLHIKSSNDAIIAFQTTDNTWLYTQWLNSSGVRKAWTGLDYNLGSFNISVENGADKILFNGGNVGIGSSTPLNKLQLGDFNNNLNLKISIPGVYNFEEIKLGQYGNGQDGLEFINHSNATQSSGVRLFSSTDTGMNGLQIQTAPPATSYATLNYITRLAVTAYGNIGIGTINPDEKLTVKGKIHAEEVRIDLNVPVPDYVFANDYKLKTLNEVEDYIKENNHLPEIPSAKEIEKNGLMLAEMNMALLKKMEEMTLYMIEQNKKMIILEKKIQVLESNPK